MSHDLIEIELGAAGQHHVKDHLMTGGTLAKFLLGQVELDEGVTSALVPPGTSIDRACRFDEGGLMASSQSYTEAGVLISSLLAAATNDMVFVAENAMARVGDPDVELERWRFALGSEVCEYRTGAHSTPTDVRDALVTANASYTLNGFVLPLPRTKRLPEFCATADQSLLEDFGRPRLVLVRAYDGEGFVFWMPNPD